MYACIRVGHKPGPCTATFKREVLTYVANILMKTAMRTLFSYAFLAS
jgi:hypothetical protein